MDTNAYVPVIPLKELVIFPNSVTPLVIMRHRSLLALEAGLASDKRLFLTTQKSPTTETPRVEDLHRVGTMVEVIQVLRLPDGSAKVLVEGLWVGRVLSFARGMEYMAGRLKRIRFSEDRSKEMEALKRSVLGLFERYGALSDKVPEDLAISIRKLDDPYQLANAIANYGSFRIDDKQRVLEAPTIKQKMQILSKLLAADNELLKIENKILSQVKSQIGKNQREYFLNEQLRAIERELGLASEEDMEIEELHTRIEQARMSKAAKEKAMRELTRLVKMTPLSPEATVSRTYIEWLTELPWKKATKDRLSLKRAQKILDDDHCGLEKPKERIIEYLAVHKLVKRLRGPILCFVGPPGVGKTSLAKSIASSLNREFVRFSLGGLRDEAEIRGHRRTYIGSMPGKIIQSMKKVGVVNPVFLLDEIDKMSSDFRGDPASALLETLDPEQNKAFDDHYLDVEYDLSRVMFITTANTMAGIPLPLLDRMEVIRLPGYTEQEKREIAINHLIPRQIEAHGLTGEAIAFDRDGIEEIIRSYTHEAGVRNLEREIAAICRKVARSIVSNKTVRSVRLTPKRVQDYLGPVRYQDPALHKDEQIGVATGLAWTEVGGELLPVETTLMPGKGTLTLTGKLGDVMQESAKAALSYIRTHYKEFGLTRDFYSKLEIHVHVPEGAIPKDGPSAGTTLAISMLSALTGRPVRRDIAMTGEITLLGNVLKIGGLKEKVIAAHRAHIGTILLPRDNVAELEEITKEIRDKIRFIPVQGFAEIVEIAFVRGETEPKAKKTSSDSEIEAARAPKRRKRPTANRRPPASAL